MTYDESLDQMMTSGNQGGQKHYFGQLTILDVWDCILEKGRGKVPFDPAYHSAESRRVAITMTLTCTKNDHTPYDIQQNDLASGDKYRLTLASLKKLGIETRAQLTTLAGRYVQATRQPTGGTYIAKKGERAGQTVNEEALVILALYPDADACKAAETAFYTPRSSAESSTPLRNVPQLIETHAIDSAARDLLLKSIPMLWAAAARNPAVFAGMLNANPKYLEHGLTPDADEVQVIIGEMPF